MISVHELKLVSNYGILQFELPSSLFAKVKEKVEFMQSTKFSDMNYSYNNDLAGQIEKELKFYPDMEFRTFLENIEGQYTEYFNFHKGITKKLSSSWINFQKKYEYNPLHHHFGKLSFVVWIKIPYILENEDRIPSSINANSKQNGRFYLVYNSNFDGISTLKVDLDKTYEGKGIIFPANASHYVHPFFTSDDYRISISGNFS